MMNWESEQLDLDTYFARIGYTGERNPTPETLAALHRAHTTAIPFENLEILLGRPVLLDIASLQRKLITMRRGGYCFENVVLFAAALEALGFNFMAVLGRVSLGVEACLRPATHALLVVEFDEPYQRFLCDVGFGRGPLEPIELIDGIEMNQDGWLLRLTHTSADGASLDPDIWTLWQRSEIDGELKWIDRHVWSVSRKYPIDFFLGNYYVSTSPRSPFTMRPFLQRFHVDHHDTLDGRIWTTISPDGRIIAQQEIEYSEWPKLLVDVFDIELDAEDVVAMMSIVESD